MRIVVQKMPFLDPALVQPEKPHRESIQRRLKFAYAPHIDFALYQPRDDELKGAERS